MLSLNNKTYVTSWVMLIIAAITLIILIIEKISNHEGKKNL